MAIEGRLVPFPDGRMVFLAEREGICYVAFKSARGDDLKFKISREALDTLVAMALDPVVGTPTREFPHKRVPQTWGWKIVAPTD